MQITDLFNVQPWPSTYIMGEKGLKPSKIIPNFSGRKAGAFRCAIPPLTIGPPQIHLIAERDGKPFQELLTGLDKSLLVAYYDPKTKSYTAVEYSPGQEVIIPEYKIHWLINPHVQKLNFTCEYAPHPWDENDEPEFPDLTALLKFVEEKGLMEEIMGGEIKENGKTRQNNNIR